MTTPDPLSLTAIRSRSRAIAAMTPDERTWFLTELAGRFPDVFDAVLRAINEETVPVAGVRVCEVTARVPCPRCGGPACAGCGRCPGCDGPAREDDDG